MLGRGAFCARKGGFGAQWGPRSSVFPPLQYAAVWSYRVVSDACVCGILLLDKVMTYSTRQKYSALKFSGFISPRQCKIFDIFR